MIRIVRKHLRDVIAIAAVAVVGILVGAYILSNQRFYAPSWVPLIGSDFVDYEAEFSSAQAFTAGQGQTVMIAGVNVGEIGSVNLRDGRARIVLKIRRKYTPIFRDATALSRPKTGLNDMVIELNPGTSAAGALPADGVIPVSRTLANVNPDEVLAGLDVDTQRYLQLLIGGAGEGLDGNAANLSATLKRFDPTARYMAKIGEELVQRQRNIKRAVHNFRLLTDALGDRNTQLADFVSSSNDVFKVFATQQADLRAALRLLPSALKSTQTALASSDTLTTSLGPTLEALLPAARGLAAAQKGLQKLATDTTPVIQNQLRPFVPKAAPTVSALRPAARDLAKATPQLTQALTVVNKLVNGLAFNPSGKNPDGSPKEGFLFWLAWANHATAAMFSSQDAMGPIRRGIVFGNCTTLQTLEVVGTANPVLGTIASLLNAPSSEEACPVGGG
ncbi:unannotated protein [freshwater metagenome]|uniref:Unannotated protein n=1 Tax=freshwater metagenome TaxID=449393 RepID=A0A6J7EGY1_9ZZZZ|nr:MCE family protein [Actinomycetota bacterium]